MTYVSLDIGGTNTRIATADDLSHAKFTSPPVFRRNVNDYTEDMHFIIQAVRLLTEYQPIEAVGVRISGTIDRHNTHLESARYLPHWIDQPFIETLRTELGCSIYAENDSVADGLGEAYYDNTPENFCYIVWGTGIGGSNVTHTPGDLPVEVEMLDQQKYFKAWEDDCGGRELEQKFVKPLENLHNEDWSGVMKTFTKHVTSFANLTGTSAIIFGGGLSLRHANAINSLKLPRTTVRVAKLGSDSGLYGGFGVIRQNLNPVSSVK
jgi:hypothetical protein